jgi:small subunit ribosomal protein S19
MQEGTHSLTETYWQRVQTWLVETGKVPLSTAKTAVAAFRKRAKPAGEAVYNVDPERLAKDLQQQIDLKSKSTSTSEARATARLLKKGPHVDERLLAKVLKQGVNKEPIKTWSRDCTIIPDFVGATFLVHNGKTFRKVYVTEEMVGHKLGEFSPILTFKRRAVGKQPRKLA